MEYVLWAARNVIIAESESCSLSEHSYVVSEYGDPGGPRLGPGPETLSISNSGRDRTSFDYGLTETSLETSWSTPSTKWVPRGAVKFALQCPTDNSRTKFSTEIAMSPAHTSPAILVRTIVWPASPRSDYFINSGLLTHVCPISAVMGSTPMTVEHVIYPNLAAPSAVLA